jgi:predicted dehydrogenase
MGGSNVNAASGENIVALCDVDDNYAAGTFKRYPKAKTYRDYRKMLDQQKDIDAVIVATPDHTHAVISMAAIKSGKNVYCQKPLTHCVYEARMLTEAARKAGVVTQMGNQGHSGEGIRLVCEWIWDGAIGAVREVHAWTNRPIWPQGLDRPEDTPAVPDTLDWDLWLGPAPERPYNPVYLPFSWRGWWDFGTGALGDMACHIIDPAFWALKLGYPIGVEACATKVNSESAPVASIVRYEFPSRGDMPPVKLTWYDGGMMPARPEELEPNRRMGDNEGGVLFVGDKGKLVCGCYGSSPRLIPETKMQEYQRPEKTIARVDGAEGGHERDWIRCCKEGRQPSSSFDYSGPLTETVVMGNLAIRCNGKKLDWDGLNMKVTNVDEANQYVRDQYRQGWSL